MAVLYADTGYFEEGYTLDDITIEWNTKIINVPRAAMTLVQTMPTVIYELSLIALHQRLRDLEDDAEGITFDTTHNYVGSITVGGVQLAPVVELINNYTVTFEDGQYAVNLSSANSNVGDNVNVNQVSVRSANSAGLIQTAEIEYGSFQGAVTLDAANGAAGQAYPIGTKLQPVNNLSDAIFIATLRGFDVLDVIGDYTFTSEDVIDKFTINGQSPNKTALVLGADATITNCEFRNASVSGSLDGGTDLFDCHVGTLEYVDGTLKDCQLNEGVITLSGILADFINCWSGVAGVTTPVIDMFGGGTDFILRNYHGGLELRNHVIAGANNSIDLSSGHIILDSTISAGEFTVRGVGKLTNNTTGTAIVYEELLDSRNLNQATFVGGQVYFDSSAPTTGTIFPCGTPEQPVSDLGDAITVARNTGLRKINYVGFATATGAHNLDDITLQAGTGSSNVIVLAGATTNRSEFANLIVIGAFDGLARIRECVLGSTGLGGVTGVQGLIVQCTINHVDGITQAAAGAGTLLDNCNFVVPDDLQVSLDANGKGLSLRGCTGNILLENATVVEDQQINLLGARLEVAPSCTAGQFIVEGIGHITDNSAGTVVIDKTTTNSVDSTTEPTSPPSETDNMGAKVSYLYAKAVNKVISDGSQQVVRNSADDADIGTEAYAEVAGVLTREKDV